MLDMGLAEFADQVKARRGRLSQANLAVLSGVSKSTIERLETKRGDAPRLGRNQAIDLASALGWDVNEALAMLGYGPLSNHDHEYLLTEAVRAKLDRLWPRLTTQQQHSLVALVASMVTEDAPPAAPPGRGYRGLKLRPGSGEIPDPRDDQSDDL